MKKTETKKTRVLAYRDAHPQASFNQIAKAAGCSANYVGVVVAEVGKATAKKTKRPKQTKRYGGRTSVAPQLTQGAPVSELTLQNVETAADFIGKCDSVQHAKDAIDKAASLAAAVGA